MTKIYIDQILRSSSSIGANYIEANNALGFKDCLNHLRIARKEARETQYWLRILEVLTPNTKISLLSQEAKELMLILSAMLLRKKNIPNEF